ncbi:hypothetical protein Tco_0959817 [Tanacetum coccineum]
MDSIKLDLDQDLAHLQAYNELINYAYISNKTPAKFCLNVFGGLDWSPEEGYAPSKRKGKNNTCTQNESGGKLRAGKCTNGAKMIEEEALAYQRSFFSHG